MSLATYNAGLPTNVERVYFSGTTALRKGQILCYKHDATVTDADATKPDPKIRMGQNVVVINSSNKTVVAGFVSDADAGRTGPCFVELIRPRPGDVFEAEVDGTVDIAVLDPLKPDDTKGALIKDASVAVNQTYALALEAYTTDNTKKVIRCYKL